MRLWHYELIPYLPTKQLRGQWRELNSIFANQPNHILINYVYEYPKNDLYSYSIMIVREIYKRGMKIIGFKKFYDYFGVSKTTCLDYVEKPFKYHHNKRYLIQCFYNLQEKLDRGQNGFDLNKYYEIQRIVFDGNIQDRIFFASSRKPKISETDTGMFRRIMQKEEE